MGLNHGFTVNDPLPQRMVFDVKALDRIVQRLSAVAPLITSICCYLSI